MDAKEFSEVKVGDIVFLDFTKYSSAIKSITGKVIDIGKTSGSEWAVVYSLNDNDSWSCQRWNRAWITSIVSSSSESEDGQVESLREENLQLKQENETMRSKIQALVLQMMDVIR